MRLLLSVKLLVPVVHFSHQVYNFTGKLIDVLMGYINHSQQNERKHDQQ